MNGIREFVNAFYENFEKAGFCIEEDQQLPSREDLEEVCGLLLNISCIPEEARYPAFRVCFIRPDSEFLDAYIYSHILLFEEPVPFVKRNLVKLAPALSSDRSYLVLDLRTKPFAAVGIIASYTVWEKIVTGELKTGTRMPRIPNIAVMEPGRLEACFGESPIVSYTAGDILHFRTDTFTSTLVADQLRKNSRVSDRDRLPFLYRIIRHMSGYGHGGQIFITPSAEACAEVLDIKYKMSASFLFDSQDDDIYPTGKRREKERGTYADMIAKFTCVDGAVVLTKDFDLIGFGAEMVLNVPDRETPVMRFIAYDDREDPGRSFRDNGMRHRACYRFCDAVEGAVAIVLSQDGHFKACTRDNGRVVVYDNVALPIL